MATEVAPGRPAGRSWLATSGQKVITYGGALFILVCGFLGAMSHMYEWTARHQTPWFCFLNAVCSELAPTISFLLWRERQAKKWPTFGPIAMLGFSAAVSLCAQLSSTGMKFPYEKEFLACLPLVVGSVLGKLLLTNIKLAQKEAGEAEQRAELERNRRARAAELQRKQAEAAAEQRAELERKQAAEAAERQAELQRKQAAEQAEHDRRHAAELARIDAETKRHQAELEAAERAAEREARQRVEARRAEAEAAALAEAKRIEAEAVAARELAEARRLEVLAAEKEQAMALLAATVQPTTADQEGGGKAGRRSREETQTIVNAVLSTMPAGSSRADAVAAVSGALVCSARYARHWVPEDWAPGGSAGSVDDDRSGLRLVAG